MRVNDSGHGIRGVVKSVHKLKAQRHQQCDSEQNVGNRGGAGGEPKIAKQMRARIDHPDDEDGTEDQNADFARRTREFCIERSRCGSHRRFFPSEVERF